MSSINLNDNANFEHYQHYSDRAKRAFLHSLGGTDVKKLLQANVPTKEVEGILKDKINNLPWEDFKGQLNNAHMKTRRVRLKRSPEEEIPKSEAPNKEAEKKEDDQSNFSIFQNIFEYHGEQEEFRTEKKIHIPNYLDFPAYTDQ